MQITVEQALDAIDWAVEQRGEDYVYPQGSDFRTCQYRKGDAPACIVGVALHHLGVSLSTLRDMDNTDDPVIASEYVAHVLEAGEVYLDEDAVRVFSTAQILQDEFKTWGEARSAAHDAAS